MAYFNMKRGDTKVFDYAVVDEDDVAVDLTGATVWFTAKTSPLLADSAATIAITSVGGDITKTAGTGGTGVITIPAASTSALTVATLLYYDLQVKDTVGRIFTADEGELMVTLDITRATA
jgi:hypothetical protein